MEAMAALTRFPAPLVCLALGAGLMGCSPEQPVTRGRLALQPVPGLEATPLETSVERYAFSPEETHWRGMAPLSESIQLGEEMGLRVQGGESQEIVVDGGFDPSRFNLVWIDVLAMEDVSLRLGVEGRGANETEEPILSGSLDVHFVLAGTRQRIAFDLRGLPSDLVELRTLRILGRGLNPDWALLTVEFAQRARAPGCLAERDLSIWWPSVGTAAVVRPWPGAFPCPLGCACRSEDSCVFPTAPLSAIHSPHKPPTSW